MRGELSEVLRTLGTYGCWPTGVWLLVVKVILFLRKEYMFSSDLLFKRK